MKTRTAALSRPFVRRLLPALAALLAISARAQTNIFWTGPTTNFDQVNAAADVLVPGAISLSRNFSKWLYNTNVNGDLGAAGPVITAPTHTGWVFGTLSTNAYTNHFQTFYSYHNGSMDQVLVPSVGGPKPMIVQLSIGTTNIYLQVTFTRWPHGGGAFAYTRSTPAVVLPTPTVSITNPAPNAVFAAPANVNISASASVSSGSVTNVSFFGNSSPLGSSQGPPFSVTANSLGAGAYSLTAVATAAGVSATSSVVNISVVTPVVTSLSSPAVANNQLWFSYNVNPGLSYDVEDSSNLINWTPLLTNVPGTNPAFFTNNISVDDDFYRVGRLPNP